MKRFGLIGASGYVAPRHMKAIKEVNGQLTAAMDPSDSVGIIDSYFPEAAFFTEFERFDRHIDKLKRSGQGLDFLSICSPNYLHDSHIRFGLRSDSDVICEKPLVLNPWNLEALQAIEEETQKSVYTILQLRHHPTIMELKESVDLSRRNQVELTYITSRGKWYDYSWKGSKAKSGGIATNIGIHFFDMLLWIFGSYQSHTTTHLDQHSGHGELILANADVKWKLSIQNSDLPPSIQQAGLRTFRSIKINSRELEFSDGFTDLHTESYRQILKNNGFGLQDALPSIELVHKLRTNT